jgi:hypothetical protein
MKLFYNSNYVYEFNSKSTIFLLIFSLNTQNLHILFCLIIFARNKKKGIDVTE